MPVGRLYVVATPIGNMEDISARALRVLAEVDLVAAEDTRHARRLLDHYAIRASLTSYHEHNEQGKAPELVARMLDGARVALVTDAGTPCISDPGYRVVRAAQEAGIPVSPIPGPSAAVAALSASGLPSDCFTFHGFFPRKGKDRESLFARAKTWGGTHIFYESPRRLHDALAALVEAFPHAQTCVAREITKLFEEIAVGTPAELAERFQDDVKGECVLLFHAEPETEIPTPEQIRVWVEECMQAEGVSRRDAVRRVAQARGLSRNTVYDAAGTAP